MAVLVSASGPRGGLGGLTPIRPKPGAGRHVLDPIDRGVDAAHCSRAPAARRRAPSERPPRGRREPATGLGCLCPSDRRPLAPDGRPRRSRHAGRQEEQARPRRAREGGLRGAHLSPQHRHQRGGPRLALPAPLLGDRYPGVRARPPRLGAGRRRRGVSDRAARTPTARPAWCSTRGSTCPPCRTARSPTPLSTPAPPTAIGRGRGGCRVPAWNWSALDGRRAERRRPRAPPAARGRGHDGRRPSSGSGGWSARSGSPSCASGTTGTATTSAPSSPRPCRIAHEDLGVTARAGARDPARRQPRRQPRGDDGSLSFDFREVDAIYDQLLGIGLRPVVELSFMPAAIARDADQTVFAYRAIVSPPADWSQWRAVVSALAAHLVERYGVDEVAPLALRGVERAEPGGVLDRLAGGVPAALRRGRRRDQGRWTASCASADRPPRPGNGSRRWPSTRSAPAPRSTW